MAGPEAQEAVEQFRKLLLAEDKRAAAEIVRAYASVYQRLRRDTQSLVRTAQREGLKPWQVMRMNRMKELEKQFLRNANRFAQIAGTDITGSQRRAVGLARNATQSITGKGLPRGITLENLARIGIEWNRLPDEAFANFIGMAGDGKPLGLLLDELGAEAAPKVRAAIGQGIALGKGPAETAELVRIASGMPLSRALTIARTETNRAFREASRLQYAANPNLIKGYRRSSTKDGLVCMACLALDGTFYETNEPLDSHPNCRCAIVPDTLTYEDLGLDVPMPPPVETGQEWFARQDEATQRKMMGQTARFEAWKSGQVSLDDMVQVRSDPRWGKTASVKPLKELL